MIDRPGKIELESERVREGLDKETDFYGARRRSSHSRKKKPGWPRNRRETPLQIWRTQRGAGSIKGNMKSVDGRALPNPKLKFQRKCERE